MTRLPSYASATIQAQLERDVTGNILKQLTSLTFDFVTLKNFSKCLEQLL